MISKLGSFLFFFFCERFPIKQSKYWGCYCSLSKTSAREWVFSRLQSEAQNPLVFSSLLTSFPNPRRQTSVVVVVVVVSQSFQRFFSLSSLFSSYSMRERTCKYLGGSLRVERPCDASSLISKSNQLGWFSLNQCEGWRRWSFHGQGMDPICRSLAPPSPLLLLLLLPA